MEQLQERMAHYLDLFEEVRNRTSSDAAAASIINQIGKDTRMQAIMDERRNTPGSMNGNGDVPATTKQLSFMRQLGLDVPAGLTKKAASELIDAEKERRDAA